MVKISVIRMDNAGHIHWDNGLYPNEHKDITPYNHDCSIGALIWKASKTYNDVRFCKEAKTIIFVDVWSNSLICTSFKPSLVSKDKKIYKLLFLCYMKRIVVV